MIWSRKPMASVVAEPFVRRCAIASRALSPIGSRSQAMVAPRETRLDLAPRDGKRERAGVGGEIVLDLHQQPPVLVTRIGLHQKRCPDVGIERECADEIVSRVEVVSLRRMHQRDDRDVGLLRKRWPAPPTGPADPHCARVRRRTQRARLGR